MFADTYELWEPIGMEKEIHITETSEKRLYQWMKFNLEAEQYINDTENITYIVIDGIEHTPVYGKVS